MTRFIRVLQADDVAPARGEFHIKACKSATGAALGELPAAVGAYSELTSAVTDRPTGKNNMANNSTGVFKHTADIVSAFVGQNHVSAEALSDLIRSVYIALVNIDAPAAPAAPVKQRPAVSIKKSITPDFLISLEDGNKYKFLKRHLRTKYNMFPEDYRAKWGLPKDYPMVAPAYAASRSAHAKRIGLGQGGEAQALAPTAPKARTARASKA